MCPQVGHRLKSYIPCAPKANVINLYTNTTAVSTGLPITSKGLHLIPFALLIAGEPSQCQEEPKSERRHNGKRKWLCEECTERTWACTNKTCIIQYVQHLEHYATNNDKSANKTSVL